MMTKIENEEQDELAVARVEELLPLVHDDTPSTDPNCIELDILSNLVADYSDHFPIAIPALQLDKSIKEAVAEAVDGTLLDTPIGIVDLIKGNRAWQLNIITTPESLNLEDVPVMVGLCSPDYSYGISDPHVEADKTGQAVLNIWNERVNTSSDYYDEVRRLVLVYTDETGNISLFERNVERYRSKDYAWSVNSEGYLVGKHRTTGKISFTWKPIGSQFFIHEVFRKVQGESVEKFGVKWSKKFGVVI